MDHHPKSPAPNTICRIRRKNSSLMPLQFKADLGIEKHQRGSPIGHRGWALRILRIRFVDKHLNYNKEPAGMTFVFISPPLLGQRLSKVACPRYVRVVDESLARVGKVSSPQALNPNPGWGGGGGMKGSLCLQGPLRGIATGWGIDGG